MPAHEPVAGDHLKVELGALLAAVAPPAACPRHKSSSSRTLRSAAICIHRLLQGRLGRHIVAVGIDMDLAQLGMLLAGQRVVTRRSIRSRRRTGCDAPGAVVQVGGEQLDRVACGARNAPRGEAHVVARRYCSSTRPGQQVGARHHLADGEAERHRRIGLNRADAVGSQGHRGDDDHVPAAPAGRGWRSGASGRSAR